MCYIDDFCVIGQFVYDGCVILMTIVASGSEQRSHKTVVGTSELDTVFSRLQPLIKVTTGLAHCPRKVTESPVGHLSFVP